MKPNIGISDNDIKSSVSMLSLLLGNEMVLYVKTRKSHWNVSGNSFMELHKLYESQYKQLEEQIDEIAERIGKMGEHTIGTMQEFIKNSSIKESPAVYLPSMDTLQELLSDHESIIIQLRKDISELQDKNMDVGSADFLTGLLESHETNAWVLRRYLK